jgi:membrane protease YdiL (CAAX protease family)
VLGVPGHLIRSYPITAFAVLACAFGWLPYLFAALGVGSDPGNLPLGPLLAAAIVAAVMGRDALREWGRRLRSWSAPPVWYAIAVIAPIAVHVGIVLANHGFGAALPTADQLAGWTALPGAFAFILVLVGIGEEAGWTAFAAPALLRRYGVLGAWAVLAPIRILWHLPLMLTGDMPWLMGFIGNAAFQLLMLWVLQGSGGRWTPAAVWHTTLNTVGGNFLFQMVDGADRDRLGLLLSLAYALLALAVLPSMLRRERAALPGAARQPAVRAGATDRDPLD